MIMTSTQFAQVAEELLSEYDGIPQPPGREQRTRPLERLSAALHQHLSEMAADDEQEDDQ